HQRVNAHHSNRPDENLPYPSQPQNFSNHRTGLFNLSISQSRVHQEHQTGLSQFLRNRQALSGTPVSSIKGFFQIHLGAGTLETRHTTGNDFIDNSVPIPTLDKTLRTHLHITLVMGVHRASSFIKLRHPHRIRLPTGLPDTQCIASPRSRPAPHPLELNTPDNALHFGHPPVGAKAAMQPAKARRTLTLIYVIPRLAGILVRPPPLPQLAVIGGDHAALPASSHDLVLAERPGPDMTDRANRAP